MKCKIIRTMIISNGDMEAYDMQRSLAALKMASFDTAVLDSAQEGLKTLEKKYFDLVIFFFSGDFKRDIGSFLCLKRAARPAPVIAVAECESGVEELAALEKASDDYLMKGHFDNESLSSSLFYALNKSAFSCADNDSAALYPVKKRSGFGPRQLAAGICDMEGGAPDRKRLEIWAVLDEGPGFRVITDPAGISQVLSDLGGDSLKFRENGGVKISAVPDDLSFALNAGSEKARPLNCPARPSGDCGFGVDQAVFGCCAVMNNAGGNQAIANNFVNAFIRHYARNFSELKKAFENGNVEKIKFHAHKLKGSALNGGADSLAKLLNDIETDKTAGIIWRFETIITGLEAGYEKYKAEVAKASGFCLKSAAA